MWSFEHGYTTALDGEAVGILGESWLDLDYAHRLLFDVEEIVRQRTTLASIRGGQECT